MSGWDYVCSYTKPDGTQAKAAYMVSGDHTGRDIVGGFVPTLLQNLVQRIGGRPAYAAVNLPAGAAEPPATFTGPAPALASPSATIPPTMQAERPQALLARGLRELSDDLVTAVERADNRGEARQLGSTVCPDRLRDLEAGTGLSTIRQALELLHAAGLAVSPDAI